MSNMSNLEGYPLSLYYHPDWLGRYLGVMANSEGVLYRASAAVRRLVACDLATALRALQWLDKHQWGQYLHKEDQWWPVVTQQPIKVLASRKPRRSPTTQVVAPTDAPPKEEQGALTVKPLLDTEEE